MSRTLDTFNESLWEQLLSLLLGCVCRSVSCSPTCPEQDFNLLLPSVHLHSLRNDLENHLIVLHHSIGGTDTISKLLCIINPGFRGVLHGNSLLKSKE